MLTDLVNEYYFWTNSTNKHWKILRALKCYYCSLEFRIIVLIRIMQNIKSQIIKKMIKKKLKLKYGIDIGLNSKIGERLKIRHGIGLVIGENVKIGNDCTIYHAVTLGQRNGEYPRLENNIVIYPGAMILGGITIGENSIIAANAVVTKNIEKNSFIIGTNIIKKG